jgi:DNA-binding transcriptional regulator YiaG
MDKHYVDEEMMVMHKSAQTLFEMGLINAAEMREFDEDCLVQEDKATPAAGVSRSKPVTPAFTSSRH